MVDDRKKAQVEHTPHLSRAAKVLFYFIILSFFFFSNNIIQIVKMADKLYNLRDIINDAPPSWDVERVQGYFVWGKKVLEGAKGNYYNYY